MHINRHGLQFKASEVWDNSTLNTIIVTWLKKFLTEYKRCPFQGVPIDFSKDGQEVFVEDWTAIIQQVIDGLSAEQPEYQGGFVEGEDNGKEVDGGIVWDIYPDNEDKWEQYQQQVKQWREDRDEALRLFAKHFDDFWT